MKQLLFLLSMLVFTACQTNAPQEEKAPGKATVTGKITNPKEEKVQISKGKETFEAKLDEKGSFTLDINFDEAGPFELHHGGEYASMFLEPGDEINLTLNTEEFDETLTYTGTGAEENNYLISKYLLNETGIGEPEDYYGAAEADFIAQSQALYERKLKHLSDFAAEKGNLNEGFLATEKTDLLYDWAMDRQSYPSYHRHYANDKDVEVSETYNDYLNQLDLDNGDLLHAETYKFFLSSHYRKQAFDIVKNDEDLKADQKTGMIKTAFNIIKSNASNPDVKEYLMYTFLEDQISFYSIDGIDEYMSEFNTLAKNETYKKELQEGYDKWMNLAAGKTAPGFTYPDIEGTKVALADFKGKNVYIDVWATWCGPCRKEIPHLEELMETYQGNDNIVFASVSIDDDKEAWEKMVTKDEMRGIQLIADEAWDSSICKDYMIRGIPRFILVDKEGNIIDSRAPRPSSDEIKALLKDLAKPVLTSMK